MGPRIAAIGKLVLGGSLDLLQCLMTDSSVLTGFEPAPLGQTCKDRDWGLEVFYQQLQRQAGRLGFHFQLFQISMGGPSKEQAIGQLNE